MVHVLRRAAQLCIVGAVCLTSTGLGQDSKLAAPGTTSPTATVITPTATDAIELYDGGSLYVTVDNNTADDAPVDVSLVFPGKITQNLLKNDSAPAKQVSTFTVPLTLSGAAAGWRLARGELVTRLGKEGATQTVTTAPVTVHARGTLISTWSSLVSFPPLAALVIVGLSVLFGRAKLDRPLSAAKFTPSGSWLTNLTFIGALATGLISALTLDAINRALALTTLAVAVALITLAPLLYQGFIRDEKTAPPGALLGASWITLTGAALALTLAFLLAPVLTDTAQGLGITTAATQGARVLQIILVLLGLGASIFAALSLIKALHARPQPSADLAANNLAPRVTYRLVPVKPEPQGPSLL